MRSRLLVGHIAHVSVLQLIPIYVGQGPHAPTSCIAILHCRTDNYSGRDVRQSRVWLEVVGILYCQPEQTASDSGLRRCRHSRQFIDDRDANRKFGRRYRACRRRDLVIPSLRVEIFLVPDGPTDIVFIAYAGHFLQDLFHRQRYLCVCANAR